jgi:Holliday junction resolvasome RuvABC DNA-binding subunit
MLGFPKAKVDKFLNQIINENGDLTVENLIKEALKRI